MKKLFKFTNCFEGIVKMLQIAFFGFLPMPSFTIKNLINGGLVYKSKSFGLGLFFLFALPINSMSQTLQLEASSNKTDIITGETLSYTLEYTCVTGNCNNVTLVSNVSSGVDFPVQSIELTNDIERYTISSDRKTITFIFKDVIKAGKSGIITFSGQGEFGLVDESTATLTAQLKTGLSIGDSKTVVVSTSKWVGNNTSEASSQNFAQVSNNLASDCVENICIPFTIKKIK